MLTKNDVRKMAALSRIYVAESNIDALAEDMSAIVEFANQIADCEISDADRALIAERGGGDTLPLMREDRMTGSPERAASLALSANSDGEYFSLEVHKFG
ncbi:MAG: hypothetical protein LBD85_06285 [Oscillospiraceae bacterium]|jgi:Asp-tRNA(Asn)/Glu-tRNA(Gln) amidotransferase C subunit|nr:hypothetical protein [Oscillospiraceae bacterium]